MTGVLKIFLQRPTIAFLLHRISHVTHCVYILTKALLFFHPTSKDGLCGAHGRRNGSMHLCHIYYKIKQRIHGDDKSNKLIKIVHICGRWMVEMEWNTPFMNLSLSFIWITWGHGYIYIFFSSLFFFMDIVVSIFFLLLFLGHASWACHLFSFFLFLIAHASFEGY